MCEQLGGGVAVVWVFLKTAVKEMNEVIGEVRRNGWMRVVGDVEHSGHWTKFEVGRFARYELHHCAPHTPYVRGEHRSVL